MFQHPTPQKTISKRGSVAVRQEPSINNFPQNAKRSLLSNNAITSHSENVIKWLRKLGYSERSIQSMEKCNNFVSIEGVRNCEGCSESPEIIQFKCRCNRRTCPICAKTRKRRIRRQYLHYLETLPKIKKASLYFLTISPENYQESFKFKKKIKKNKKTKEKILKGVEAGLEHIKQSYNRFLRLDYIKKRVLGSLFVIESRNKNRFGESKGWNTHIHAIIYGKRLDNQLRGKCLDCKQNLIKFDYKTKEYYCANQKCQSRNVKFKKDSKIVSLWKKSSKRNVNIQITKISNPSFLLNYLLKYISANKDDFMTEKDIAKYIIATNKKRLISTTGFFYKHPPKKEKGICWKCGKKVEYIFDYEVLKILKEAKDEPKDLWDYVIESKRRCK